MKIDGSSETLIGMKRIAFVSPSLFWISKDQMIIFNKSYSIE